MVVVMVAVAAVATSSTNLTSRSRSKELSGASPFGRTSCRWPSSRCPATASCKALGPSEATPPR
eukprot:scaffold26696_cov60-Phaeocystis_antarctica.AAC.2